ncbi:MAG TPA: YchJ family metal-binding protein, partial [Gammaproteobacteria bacterium]|nr:YchJ family metal-binding protein [Gammaproteobacteria bacterium]
DHFNLQAAAQDAKQTQWQGLEVLASKAEGDQAQVEFKAYYQEQGQKFCLHERSDFRREAGRWYYVDGQIFPSQKQPIRSSKIQRNDPCPCGSQKKYKKCCG